FPFPLHDALPILVPVRARHDGWTVERQFAFVEKLADCGSISAAPTPRFASFFRSVTANIGEDWRASSPGDCRAPISRQIDSRAAWSTWSTSPRTPSLARAHVRACSVAAIAAFRACAHMTLPWQLPLEQPSRSGRLSPRSSGRGRDPVRQDWEGEGPFTGFTPVTAPVSELRALLLLLARAALARTAAACAALGAGARALLGAAGTGTGLGRHDTLLPAVHNR